jgi:hypothetical protein
LNGEAAGARFSSVSPLFSILNQLAKEPGMLLTMIPHTGVRVVRLSQEILTKKRLLRACFVKKPLQKRFYR